MFQRRPHGRPRKLRAGGQARSHVHHKVRLAHTGRTPQHNLLTGRDDRALAAVGEDGVDAGDLLCQEGTHGLGLEHGRGGIGRAAVAVWGERIVATVRALYLGECVVRREGWTAVLRRLKHQSLGDRAWYISVPEFGREAE